MNRRFHFTRRHACLLALVVATLALSIVFDLTIFASALFPARWVTTLGSTRCRAPTARIY